MAKQRVIAPYPDEQSTAAWCFSDYYAFDEQAILAFAPQDSGVYGLYSFDRQIFIGESANIRESLLHHYRNPDSKADSLRPTRFMFEICSGGSQAQRAQELVANYQPVSETEPHVDDSWVFVSGQEVNDQFSFDPPLNHGFDAADRSLPGESRPVEHHRFSLSRGKIVALGATLALSLSLIFHFGLLKGNGIQNAASAGFKASGIGIPNGTTDGAPRRPTLPAATKNEARTESIELTPEAKPKGGIEEIDDTPSVSATKPETTAAAAAHRVAATDANRTLPGGRREGASPSVEIPAGRESAWTVQVGAGIKKSLVEEQVAQLKAKGYESYMVETERDGQIWYRVRVGRFKTRGEAEALRENLASRKAYRSLFITKD